MYRACCRDDPDYADAVRIENTLGIPVVRHEAKKPGGIEDVLAFFAEKDPDVRLDELCFVGDRLLTDVVFGNLHGMLTIHTQPLTLEGDNRPAAIFRFLERKVTRSPACETNGVVSHPSVMLQACNRAYLIIACNTFALYTVALAKLVAGNSFSKNVPTK